MVFRRRGMRSRRSMRRRGGIKSMARGKASKFTKLARAVRTLQRKNARECEYLTFSQNIPFATSFPASPAPLVQNLSYYTGFTNVFGVSADDLEANKIIHKSIGMDIRVSLENTVNNEEETTNFTAFLISLKDDIGSYFTPGSGAITWTDNITHSFQNGLVLLNKKMFNIHKQKRFTLTNFGTALTSAAAQSQYGVDKRWYWKISPNKLISNPAGNWKSLSSGLDPSKTYQLVVFSDNATLDGESPSMTAAIVHTMKTVA